MMNLPDPPWKEKTRPCPFYSQGRCLFADSCNFLHTVKIHRQEDALLSAPESTLPSPPSSPSPSSRSGMAPKSVRFRSPPRSPRLSSLLLALGNVIQQDEENEEYEDEEYEDEEEEEAVEGPEIPEQSTISEGIAAAESPSVHVSDPLAESEGRRSGTDEDAESTTLISSTVGGSPEIRSPAFTPRSSYVAPDSDADSDEGEVTITAFRESQVPTVRPSSELLSPIQIQSTPLSFPRALVSTELRREDSFDSGFAEGCYPVGPVPASFLTSPPRSPRRVSTLSILSSPFGSPTTRMRQMQLHGQAELEAPAVAELFTSSFRNMDVDGDAPSARYSDVDDDPLQEDPTGGADEGFDEPSFEVIAESPVGRGPSDSDDTSFREDAVDTLYDGYLDDDGDQQSALPSPYETEDHAQPRVFYPPTHVSTDEERGRPLLTLPPQSEPTIYPSSALEKGKSPQRKTPPSSFTRASSRESTSQSRERTWDKRASTKVPLAWRQSTTVDRPASISRRQSQTPGTVRPRPPPLVGFNMNAHDRTHGQLKELHLLSPEDNPAVLSGGLRPLRLSMILTSTSNSSSSSLSLSTNTPSISPGFGSSIPPPLTTGTTAHSYTPTPISPTVSSEYSFSHNHLLSSRPSPSSSFSNGITAHRDTLIIESKTHAHVAPSHSVTPMSADAPRSAPNSRPPSSFPPRHSRRSSRFSSFASRRLSQIGGYDRPDSRLSEPAILYEDDEDNASLDNDGEWMDDTVRRPASSLASVPMPSNLLSPPSPAAMHAIATPRPTLMFALASDNVGEVRRVLESGEARPNDAVGPQSALAFTLTATQLKNRVEMVKLLLAHGADPSAIAEGGPDQGSSQSSESANAPSPSRLLEQLDPATKYYLQRAAAPQTRRASALIHRSFFRPLARVRFELIGQDRALEQLFRVLSMPMMTPIVVLFCGPSGHGKSLLARKFGSLLDVPTHTVNMTTLRSTHDIWRSYSMSPYEATSTCTLAEFLIANEGRRCVVVLDEIEKVADETFLSSLLMPWELGRCSFEAGHRHVDVSQVIWLGTSNVGHELVFEHQRDRQDPETAMSREEYVDLMALLRPRVSEKLGASLLSRVTTVLPFVPFTPEEKMAICAEALHSLTGDGSETLPPATVNMITRNSLRTYLPAEGARSLYRAVSTLLLDTI